MEALATEFQGPAQPFPSEPVAELALGHAGLPARQAPTDRAMRLWPAAGPGELFEAKMVMLVQLRLRFIRPSVQDH